LYYRRSLWENHPNPAGAQYERAFPSPIKSLYRPLSLPSSRNTVSLASFSRTMVLPTHPHCWKFWHSNWAFTTSLLLPIIRKAMVWLKGSWVRSVTWLCHLQICRPAYILGWTSWFFPTGVQLVYALGNWVLSLPPGSRTRGSSSGDPPQPSFNNFSGRLSSPVVEWHL
jgi:hypothetical protein